MVKSTAPDKALSVRGGRARLALRLSVSVVSFALTAALLEVCARLALPVPAPVNLRDAIYVSQLPLVNGHPMRAPDPVVGEPLAVGRQPGELRVFVFGESSVQGTPWGYRASAPTMLYDLLRRALPARHVTVVNMGRVSSFTMDAYYHLVSIAQYRPDFVIFYMGLNDRYDADREMCWPSEWPTVHAAWRWSVEHSRLLWTVRARGPDLLYPKQDQWNTGPPSSGRGCDPLRGFQAWSDVLVGTARAMGAQVVVTTPLRNPLTAIDLKRERSGVDLGAYLAASTPAYRTVLACLLAADCDVRGALTATSSDGPVHAPATGPSQLVAQDEARMRRMGESWKASATRYGATVLDFRAYVAQRSPGGLVQAPFVVDDIHLSVEGYLTLATLWSQMVTDLVAGLRPPPHAELRAPIADTARYREDLRRSDGTGYADIVERHALHHLVLRLPLLAVPMLRDAAGPLERHNARLALGWLRWRLGLEAQPPAELGSEAHGFDIARFARAASESAHRSAVAGRSQDQGGWCIPGDKGASVFALLPASGAQLGPTQWRVGDVRIARSEVEVSLTSATSGVVAVTRLLHPSNRSTTDFMTRFFAVRAGVGTDPRVAQAVAAVVRARELVSPWVPAAATAPGTLHPSPPP